MLHKGDRATFITLCICMLFWRFCYVIYVAAHFEYCMWFLANESAWWPRAVYICRVQRVAMRNVRLTLVRKRGYYSVCVVCMKHRRNLEQGESPSISLLIYWNCFFLICVCISRIARNFEKSLYWLCILEFIDLSL